MSPLSPEIQTTPSGHYNVMVKLKLSTSILVNAPRNLKLGKVSINPLSANSDQQQFSPNNILTLSRDKVLRINKSDHQRGNAMIFCQVLRTNS